MTYVHCAGRLAVSFGVRKGIGYDSYTSCSYSVPLEGGSIYTERDRMELIDQSNKSADTLSRTFSFAIENDHIDSHDLLFDFPHKILYPMSNGTTENILDHPARSRNI